MKNYTQINIEENANKQIINLTKNTKVTIVKINIKECNGGFL